MRSTKKFDRKLYNRSDPLSNGVMIKWLQRNDYTFIDPKETYGVDITCVKGDTPAFFETEMKYNWKGDWPSVWQEVRIPYRKSKIVSKWVHDGSVGDLTFVIFRSDCKQAWFIDGQVVRDSEVIAIDTKYTKNEKFYHIDVNDAHIINMKASDLKEARSDKITDAFINVRYPS